MIQNEITYEAVLAMTTAEAEALGAKRFAEGKSFAANNARPRGFFLQCLQIKRQALVTALDKGWHKANSKAAV
jgi:hypothetical protein